MPELIAQPPLSLEVPGNVAEAPHTPESRGVPGAIEGAYRTEAAGQEQLSRGLENLATPIAQAQAATDLQNQKVTLGPDGKIQVVNPAKSLIFGQAGDAYGDAVVRGTAAQADTLVSQKMQEIHLAHLGDPQGQMTATNAFMAGLKGATGNPVIDQAIQQHAGALATEHYNNNLEYTSRLNLENNVKSLEAKVTSSREDLMSLYQAGVPDTDQRVIDAQKELKEAQDGRVNDPRMRYPADMRAEDDRRFNAALAVERQMGAVDRAMTDPMGGGRPAALAIVKSWAERADLGPYRRQLMQDGMARISAHEADWLSQVRENRVAVENAEKAIAAGTVKYGDPVLSKLIATTRGLGDPEAAQQLESLAKYRRSTQGLDKLPEPQRHAVLDLPPGDDSPRASPAAFTPKNPLKEPPDQFFSSRATAGVHTDGLNPEFATRLQSAVQDAEAATGEKASFLSLRRTNAEQAVLHANYVNGTGGLAAPPGQSLHEQGAAADLASGKVRDWLHEHAADYGLEFLHGRAGAMDRNHIQLASFRPGSPGSPSTMAIGSFDAAMARTSQEEAGFNARDANGAPVNYGINQAAHPEVDVTKLTPADAKAIYKRDYWDAIGGDDLARRNPALAHVAFDTAVVDGVPRAKEWIQQSGGDPQKLLALREAHETQLVGSDPATYAKYARTWQQRRENLRNDIASGMVGRKDGFPDASPDSVHYNPADVIAHPELMGEYFRELGAEPKDNYAEVHNIAEAITSNAKYARDLPQVPVATVMQEADKHPNDPKWQTMKADVMGAIAAVGMPANPGAHAAKVAEFTNVAAASPNLFMRQVAEAALKYEKNRSEEQQTHPYDFAFNQGLLKQPVTPIDPSRPDQLGAQLQNRADAGRLINSRAQIPAPPMIGDNEKGPFEQIMRADQGAGPTKPGEPPAPSSAGTALTSVASTMKDGDLRTLGDEKTFHDALVSAWHSGDKAQMTGAFTVLDRLERTFPNDFHAKFEKEAAEMEVWRSKMANLPTDQLPKAVADMWDPQTQKVEGELRTKAHDMLVKGSYDPTKISSLLSTGWRMFGGSGTPGAPAPADLDTRANLRLVSAFNRAFEEGVIRGNDEAGAAAYATKQISATYGASAINGGRVTFYPPEKFLRNRNGSPATVDGSFDWVNKQMDGDIRQALGIPDGIDKTARSGEARFFPGGEMTREQQDKLAQYHGPHVLIGDDTTQADYASGKSPSYQLFLQKGDGSWTPLMDEKGAPQRFYPHPPSAQADEINQLEQEREQPKNAPPFQPVPSRPLF